MHTASSRQLILWPATLVLAATFLFATACRTTRPDTQAASDGQSLTPTSALSTPDRVEIFELVWRIINERYYDPSFNGVDWKAVHERYRPQVERAADDREFYGIFELMLGELRDGHTIFEPPPPPGVPPPEEGAHRNIGLKLGEAEGKVVVVEVEPDSDAERAGVRVGMMLRTVNSKTVEEHFAFIRSLIAGSSSERLFKAKMLSALLYAGFLETPRHLGLTDFDGHPFEVELSPRIIATTGTQPNLSARRLASGFGYIKFAEWKPPVEKEFRAQLEKLMDTPGLVIDLRGNGGGETNVMLDITGNFYPAETYYGAFRTRAGGLDKYFTRRYEDYYRAPVVILVDEESASASETSTVFMQESGRAFVIGRQSAGSTHNRWGTPMPKGGGTLFYSSRAYVSPRGRDPEGTGVIPDEIVPRTIADLRQGRDAALEAAERHLQAAKSGGLGKSR